MSIKKRGQNEGSIYKRKDGRWVAQVTIQGQHISKYFKSQVECREWLRITQAQVENGLSLSGAQTSVAAYLNEWLAIAETSVRAKTIDQYKQIVRQHILPALGRIKMQDLQPRHIQSLYSKKLDSGTSPRTVQLIHSVLRRAFNQALRSGMIGRNPVLAVIRPKVKRKEMKTLTDGQVRILLSYVDGDRLEVLYWLAVTTGLREGELLGLKWSDLDWINRRLRIQRQLQRLHGELQFNEPKSAAGRRVIALGISTIEKLRKHQDFQMEERKLAGNAWTESDMIFPSTIGTPLDPSNLYHSFKRLLKEASLPDMRFHDLRHTAASLMLQQGVNPKVVQERLGHSDITLTLNTYSHVLPVMQDEAAEKLDELLTPIDVSNELKKLGEGKTSYDPTNQNLDKEKAGQQNG
ncbi:MAG: tyrosine-type recombinase/integrase [Anaerolineales bacterium]